MQTIAFVLAVAWLAFGSSVLAAGRVEARTEPPFGQRVPGLAGPGAASAPHLSPGMGEPIAAALDPYDQSAWFVTDGSLLVHVAADGALIQGASLAAPASAIAVDLDESVWIVVGRELVHFSTHAEMLGVRPLPFARDEHATSLALDPLRETAWLATSAGLYRLAEDVRRTLEGDVTSVAVDPRSGHVVAIADGTLLSLADGLVRPLDALSIVDFERPLQVTFDGNDGAFAVETTQRTWWIDGGEVVLKDEPAPGPAHFAEPFRIDPVIDILRPPSGGLVTQATSEIVARVGALCNGIACDVPGYVDRFQVHALVDGGRLPEAHVDAAGFVRWGVPSLAGPVVDFAAQATDRFGHRASASARWTFGTASASEAPIGQFGPPPDDASTTIPATKAANKPPSVALTSPATGTQFTADRPIVLAASASDPDGSIAKVEFYRAGTILLGASTAPPYAVTWAAPVVGTHSLTAKAYDNKKVAATSAPVTITVVANLAPTVELTAPAAGAFLRVGESVTVSATAGDADGQVASVQFFDGSASLGAASAAPFQVVWTPAVPGVHTLHARAIDDEGTASDSRALDVTVGDVPVVVVTKPAACSTMDAPVDVLLAADAMSTTGRIVRVDFFDNDQFVGSAATSPWAAVLVNAQIGTHSITARAVDDHGVASTSRSAELTIRAANQKPAVTLTAPSDGVHVPLGSRVDLSASATDPDGSITAVEFRLGSAGGSLIGRATSAPYTASWSPATAGTYGLVAVAFDDRNASTTSSSVRVTVDPNSPPTVALTSPANNARYVAPATIAFAANASDADGSIVKVEFFSGTTSIGTATGSPYTATWGNVAPGSYSLTARATDNAGGTATSSAVPVTVVANSPPSVALTVTSPGPYFAPATISLAAEAADSDGTIAGVEFYANGVLIGTDSAAPYAMVWDAVQGGSYALTAKAIDDAGGSTVSAPGTVSVQAEPTLTFTGGLGTSTVDDDNVLVSGYVSAPANSAVTVNGVVTHIDDRGFFQANDVPLAPGANEIVATITTQDGQTLTKSVSVDSSGPGLFKVQAAPTEGIESLKVTFTLENPQNVPFKQVDFDLDGDGYPNLIAYPEQFQDGKLTATATYPTGTWLAKIAFFDEQDHVIYETHKSIVVLEPMVFQANVRAIYENMLLRLRAGNIPGALSAFTGSAHDRFSDVFTELQPDLATIVDQLGTITEVTFNLDMAELTLVRDREDGAQKFMIYLIRSEDGIWRIDGM